jgi:transcriptional regulator with XRE-family HTH domain
VPEGISPTVARLRVRLALREARERAALTQHDVAEAMEWALSKVVRIERGDVSVAPNDLRPLLAFLDVGDPGTVAGLLALAKIARTRQRAAWHQRPEFREHLTNAMRRHIEYEAEASEIRYYQAFYMPGPLQIPAYAQAGLDRYADDDIPSETRRLRAAAREHRRQTLLSRIAAGLRVYALLDESVLHRPLGGPAVFRDQLRQMYELAAAGKVRMRMIPFVFDSAVTNNATFDLLTLPAAEVDRAESTEVLYRETALHDEIVEGDWVGRHRDRFDRVWRAAMTEDETIRFVRDRIDELEEQIAGEGRTLQ